MRGDGLQQLSAENEKVIYSFFKQKLIEDTSSSRAIWDALYSNVQNPLDEQWQAIITQFHEYVIMSLCHSSQI